MLVLHRIAKEYGKRPSEIVNIGDEWAAYQLDVAVLLASLDDNTSSPRRATAMDWNDLAKL
jgi:hypothetical protein